MATSVLMTTSVAKGQSKIVTHYIILDLFSLFQGKGLERKKKCHYESLRGQLYL